MSLLRFPEPYDFELSTGRFRAFGTDLANRLAGGTLHRAVGGREVRIAARPGGVDVEPLDDVTRPVVLQLLGAPFDLPPFYAWAAEDPVLAPIAARLRGFRPPLQPDPFEALVTSITAQQVSLFAAVAIRNRLVERLGEPVGEAWAFPTRERIAGVGEAGAGRGRVHAAQGGVRGRPRAQRPRPRRPGGARRRRRARADHGGARPRPLDGRVVPRAPSRPAARLAGRRPGAPQGGRESLRCRV